MHALSASLMTHVAAVVIQIPIRLLGPDASAAHLKMHRLCSRLFGPRRCFPHEAASCADP